MKKNIYLLFQRTCKANVIYICYAVTAFLLLFGTKAGATGYVWYSGTGQWNTCSNWNFSLCPVSDTGSIVTFLPSMAVSITGSSPASYFTLGALTSSSYGSGGSTTLSFNTNVDFTIKTLTVNNNLTLGDGASTPVNMKVAGGMVAYSAALTVATPSNLTIDSGTFIVAGTLRTSGNELATITVGSKGVLIFSGNSPIIPGGITVMPGGEIRCTGAGTVTGFDVYSIVNGTFTLAGSTTTGSGFVAKWGVGSILQYAGSVTQTANTYEFPAGLQPTNVVINNGAGVNFNTSVPPVPVITGSLTLTAGVLTLGSSTYPTLTFQNGDAPIVRNTGSIDAGLNSTATISFGTTGHTGGSAFTLPDSVFVNTSIYKLNVNRVNPLTLNNENITVTDSFHLNSGQVILGSGNLSVNANAVTTAGTLDTNTMVVTSSASGYLIHSFDTSATAKSFIYPIGEIAGAASYDGFSFMMNNNDSALKEIGFRVVDDICEPNIGSAANYTTRYYSTSISGGGNYNYSVSLPFDSSASTSCAGGGGDVVGSVSLMSTAYYDTSWNAAGIVNPSNLVITNGTQATAPLGYDIMGISISGTVPVDIYYSQYDFTIYPNPATNQLTLHASFNHRNETVTVSVMNVLGDLLQEEKLTLDNDITINIESFSAGIYFLQMKSESGSIVRQFVKE